MRIAALALVSLLAAACAPARPTTSGPSPDRKPYRVDALAFEAPSGFGERAVPLGDLPPSLRPGAADGGARGLTVARCTGQGTDSCGALGVRNATDLGAKRCADREQVRRWLRLETGDDLYAVRYADRDGWLVRGASGQGYHRVLVLCDGERLWFVKAIATGEAGVSPARAAFELFLKTVRIDGPAPAGAWIQGS